MPVSITVTKKDKEIDELCLSLARDEQRKSKCLLRHVGAIITRDRKICSSGFNGIPFGIIPCTKNSPCMNGTSQTGITCNRGCIGLCAEQAAIVEAARKGVDLNGATLYSTHSPCIRCAFFIILVGIRRVVYDERYEDESGINLLEKVGIEVRRP